MKVVYYRREFSWQVNRAKQLWNLQPEVILAFDTQYGYFPSLQAMHVKVNLAKLTQRDQINSVKLSVRKKGSAEALAQTVMPDLKNGASELTRWNLPQLDDGEYELLVAPQGAKVEPEVLQFVRHRFAWEGNTLGKSDVVVAPFTPIAVKGNVVGTLLRNHTMNGVGLWDQVVADGQPLLKAPMRLEAKLGGKVVSAQGKIHFSQTKATRAVAQATWAAGGLRGSTQSAWDYDGVMRATFTLQPMAKPVDSLTLVIPLDDAKMPLLHECTEGLRANYAGKVPVGQGRVWDSTKAAHYDIVGPYVPYIWLGGTSRGLSVFGENDRGWTIDGKSPCQEIVRNADGTLELRLNLIQKPDSWKEPRQITIGFEATPIKPLPANWRLWTVGSRGVAKVPNQYYQAFLGASLYYGSITASEDLYPRLQDFTLWDKFAQTRQSGKIDYDYFKTFMARYGLPDTPEWQKKIPGFTVHVRAGMQMMSTKPNGVAAYTNPRGMRLDTPEGQTYLDEWQRSAYPKRQVDFGKSAPYVVDPIESYRDYSAFYWNKMLTTFVDSIYWDNTFLASSTNPLLTAAYVRPDGAVQPAVSLWNMRQLVHRGAVLSQELGRPNRNMVHMTNAAIAPIIGQAGTQLGWEFSYGDTDFQERFKREDIQAEGTGLQFGNVPFVLTLINGPDKAKCEWAARTAAGVMLTHEVKPVPAAQPVVDYWKNYDRLVDFGYGSPEVKVWNYWQTDYPAKISGESSSLLLSKPGSALIVVTDWAEGGDFKVDLDLKALGLKGKLTATDAENDGAVTISESGSLTFPLKKHDYKVVRISGE